MATSPVHIADKLADKFTLHAVNLLRFEAHLRRRALTVLQKLEAELAKQIADYDPYEPSRTAYQQARLRALLSQAQQTIATAYRGIAKEADAELLDLADYENTTAADIVNRLVGADVMTVGLGETQLRAIVDDTLIEGSPSSDWWDRQTKALQRNFADQMRQGQLRGEGIDQLQRRIRGTKAAGFADGIMKATRAQASALVRSSVQGVSNGARLELFRANGDVVRGVQALAVLDSRTTPICISRSGSSWDLETGDPLPDSPRQEHFPGYPPWHWGCRTTLIAVLQPLAAIMAAAGVRKRAALRLVPKSTQASMDGQVASDLNYEAWLKTKSATFQKQVLGEAKWSLWQDGQLSLTDLIDQSGRPLSLDELRRAA